ncbi:uncharacterized protein M6G45_000743 [Spheniscus humboldti]
MVVALESSRLSLSLLQRKKGMMNCVIPQGETGASDILPKAEIPFPRSLSEVWRSSWEEVDSKKTLEAKPKTKPLLLDRSIKVTEEMEKLTVEWHLRTVLTAAAWWKKKAIADWAEHEAQRAKSTHRTQVLRAFENILKNSLFFSP